MRRTSRSLALGAAAAALVGGLVVSGAAPVSSAGRSGVHIRLHPMVFSRFVSATQPPTEALCVAVFTEPCYTPLQIEKAYNEGPLFAHGITGAGETIAIIDSFGDPSAKSELAKFDATFGLPAPPSFKVIQPAGAVPPFNPATGTMISWAFETSLDIEYSHALAPGANLLLVETPTAETEGVTGFPSIVAAENDVIDHDMADVISQSFAATEETFPSKASLLGLRTAYINAFHHQVTVLAGSGDWGATSQQHTGVLYYTHRVTDWPATDPLVTAVGGTQLHLNATGTRTAPDSVWNDSYNRTFDQRFFGTPGPLATATGGGVSSVFARPWYQDLVAPVVGGHRGVPDVSMSGACSGSVDVWFAAPTFVHGWFLVCGTSEATPEFAGVVALADQVAHHRLGLINPALYALSAFHAPGIVDVTQGNNTVSFSQQGAEYTVHGYPSGPGYDLASGVGTITAARFVPELAFTGSILGPKAVPSSHGTAGLSGPTTT